MGDTIRIVSRPEGEAPDWVRDAWIGLTLPVVRKARARTVRSVGVLSGPRTFWRMLWASINPQLPKTTGYMVKVLPAVAALEATAPEASKWWRDNAAQLLNRWGVFIFNEGCAVPTDDNV